MQQENELSDRMQQTMRWNHTELIIPLVFCYTAHCCAALRPQCFAAFGRSARPWRKQQVFKYKRAKSLESESK